MKLSDFTSSVLRNFSGINSNLVINAGSVVKTMSESKTIMAVATVAEPFDGTFGIYDLNEFLSTINMFDDSDIVISSDMKYAAISEGNRSVKYFFSEPSILTTPQKDIVMPPCEITFTLSTTDMASIRKAASALGVSDLVVDSSSGKLVLRVTNVSDNTSNSFEIATGVDVSVQANCVFNISNFKFIQDDYDVSISSRLISNFKAKNNPIEYWVALEKTSTFGG